MKTVKQCLAILAITIIAICNAVASPKVKVQTRVPVGVPYSLEYIAAHSPSGKVKSYFASHVIFKEYAATNTVYRTYDWQVTFYPVNGNGEGASFSTDDYYFRWAINSPADEQWLGATCDVVPGTYTVVVQNISGVGGTYDVGVNFTDANGYGGSSYKWDWNSGSQDATLNDVYVDGVNELEVYVSKTEF